MGPVPHACWTWSRGAPRRFQGLAPGPRIAASRCPNDADPTCSASSSGAPSTASATMPSLSAPPLIATSSLSPASVVAAPTTAPSECRSEEHTSELQSRGHLVCRLLLEKKKKKTTPTNDDTEPSRH